MPIFIVNSLRTLCVTVLPLFLLACGGSIKTEDRSAPALLNSCPGFAVTGKPPIVSGAECGVLPVAENPAADDGANIGLNILRLPAINPVPKDDPLFIIAGGPGQSAVEVAQHLFYAFEDVRKSRDIIFIDQRGTGKSNPLQCDGLAAMAQSLPIEELKEARATALRECVDELGERVAFYTTPYAVQDMESVRVALGYQKINVWGVSYGTRVALEYMRRYPHAVRTCVLDGLAPASIALPWSAETDAMNALAAINQQCAALADCQKRYGDLIAKAEAVSLRLAAGPVAVEIKHPSTRLPYRVDMSVELFASVVRLALYSRDLARILPLAIHQAYEEDYQLITALISLAERRSGFADISLGMHFTVLCNEDYPQYQAREFVESEHFLRLGAVKSSAEICAQWPRFPLPEKFLTELHSDVPTLLLSGARDPVTPPVWAEQVKAGLTRVKHGVAPGGHHSITRDGCVAKVIAQFIHTGDIERLDIACIEKILPMQPYYDVDPELWEAANSREPQANEEGAAP